MSRFEELHRQAREMSPKEWTAQLHSLARDPRFAAVLAFVESQYNGWVDTAASQKLSYHHGPLAHAQGSVYAIKSLRGALRVLVNEKERQSTTPGDGPDREA